VLGSLRRSPRPSPHSRPPRRLRRLGLGASSRRRRAYQFPSRVLSLKHCSVGSIRSLVFIMRTDGKHYWQIYKSLGYKPTNVWFKASRRHAYCTLILRVRKSAKELSAIRISWSDVKTTTKLSSSASSDCFVHFRTIQHVQRILLRSNRPWIIEQSNCLNKTTTKVV